MSINKFILLFSLSGLFLQMFPFGWQADIRPVISTTVKDDPTQ